MTLPSDGSGPLDAQNVGQFSDDPGKRATFLFDIDLLAPPRPLSRAEQTALDDDLAVLPGVRRFSRGDRPVIRWIKGDGLDDAVTRAAIGQATRLFGEQVDYCLCTVGLDPARVRDILAWAACPVEWWPITPADNPVLSSILREAGCPPENYGYWWKWFPERVRPDAPEWIMDGDMVVVGKPAWFDAWKAGRDCCRVSQDDGSPAPNIFGRYLAEVDMTKRLYSGLISLRPGQTYMQDFVRVLAKKPLLAPHDGRIDMCEQGVVAAAFQDLAEPVPLCEFPFGRAFEPTLDFGLQGDQGRAWGYHFGNAFRRDNPHFDRLVAEGVVFSQPEPGIRERFAWLGGFGQWGIPGWGMPHQAADAIIAEVLPLAGRRVLELGTSRGHMSAILATIGCEVTTVDRHHRGAAQNLAGLPARVVQADALDYLAQSTEHFAAIVVDVHGNSPAVWERLGPMLLERLAPGGKIVTSNARLHHLEEWRDEVGVARWLEGLGPSWEVVVHEAAFPGVAVVTRREPIPFNDLGRAHAPLRPEIDAAFSRVIDRGSFLRGPEVDAFEREWAAFCGQEHAVCCNSGTDALTIAAMALGLERVQVPATTLPLTALGLRHGGAEVEIADVGDDGRLLAPGPDAVPVLFYGRPPGAAEAGARLFDAAHAHGWQPPRGSLAAFSFYPTKTLGALGDGGAVTTDDACLAEEMRRLCGRDDRLMDGRQITSRMDEVQAAVLRAKLPHLPAWLEERRAVGAAYESRLAPLGITLAGPSLRHLYVIRVPQRDRLAAALASRGIGVKIHWETPLHRLAGPWRQDVACPGADAWCASVLSLPCFPGLRQDEIDRVCDAVEDELGMIRRSGLD
jgi:dTDP-4-amino-4,6-dideoxygalactose transaminase